MPFDSEVQRATRYTPAVTIVAAWIRAEAGVGPSIASGNHTCSGNWADLPIAPRNRHRQMAVSVPSSRSWPTMIFHSDVEEFSTVSKLSDPNDVQIRNIATSSPRSPIRLTTNAFLAAAAALGFLNQNPIS